MKHTYFTPHDIPSVLQGHRPWSNGTSNSESREKALPKSDSPEQIQKCLQCERPECRNCQEAYKQKKQKNSRKDTIPDSFRGDAMQGMSLKELAKRYQVGTSTITKWKRELGINGKTPLPNSVQCKPRLGDMVPDGFAAAVRGGSTNKQLREQCNVGEHVIRQWKHKCGLIKEKTPKRHGASLGEQKNNTP